MSPRRPEALSTELARELGLPLELARVPHCRGLRLWRVASSVDLEAACQNLADTPSPPFWAFCWGAGQALARYILANPAEVRGRHVVDLGTGGGIVAIAAARAGASRVQAVDVDPVARRAASINALENGVELETLAELPLEWDVLLAADVLYEASARERIADWAHSGRSILIAAPHRAGRPATPGQPICELEATTLPDVDPPVRTVTVARLSPSVSGPPGARPPA